MTTPFNGFPTPAEIASSHKKAESEQICKEVDYHRQHIGELLKTYKGGHLHYRLPPGFPEAVERVRADLDKAGWVSEVGASDKTKPVLVIWSTLSGELGPSL